MDFNTQLAGLNELMCIVYGDEMSLDALLADLGFEPSQIESLTGRNMESVAGQFLAVVHKRLTNYAGRDTYYHILSRRYGLDGEPREQLGAIGEKHGYSPEYTRQLFEEILQRCRSKAWQKELGISLKQIVVAELGKMNKRPAKEHVAAKLERLTSLQNAADLARLDYEAKRNDILRKVQAELDALDLEYKPILEATEENIAALENEIKTEVLLYGESVSGGMYRATYSQGRVSWDNEGMTRYAASHPDVLQFRKQGQPIITLRIVTKE